MTPFTIEEIVGLYRENRYPPIRAWFRERFPKLAPEFDAIERDEQRRDRMEAQS